MVQSLIGTYRYNVDEKGRMSFPAKFRDLIGDTFVITKATDRVCLTIYSLKEWERLIDMVKELPLTKSTSIKRTLFTGAVELSTDKQGRILIPGELRKYAGIEKDAAVVGVGDKAEIWNAADWDAYNDSIDLGEITSLMESLGF